MLIFTSHRSPLSERLKQAIAIVARFRKVAFANSLGTITTQPMTTAIQRIVSARIKTSLHNLKTGKEQAIVKDGFFT